MIGVAASAFSGSLADPPPSSVILPAAQWIQGALLGTIATGFAILAVAMIGVLMLSGRIAIRQGATVIIGCFIVFGAANIARGLRGASEAVAGADDAPPMVVAKSDPVIMPTAPSKPREDYPPYAGAALLRRSNSQP